jgi:hypothetical protein
MIVPLPTFNENIEPYFRAHFVNLVLDCVGRGKVLQITSFSGDLVDVS